MADQILRYLIHYVRFLSPVSIGGEFGALDSWSRDKHGPHIDLEERGNWLVLTIRATNERRRIPVTNCSYVSERLVEDIPKGMAK